MPELTIGRAGSIEVPRGSDPRHVFVVSGRRRAGLHAGIEG
jgi:hypothetical protein